MNIRKLIKECVLEELHETLSQTSSIELQYKQYIFPKLDDLKFIPGGSGPSEYREFYQYAFATIQCIIENGEVQIHRFYDDEGLVDNNMVKKFKLPSPFSAEFADKIVEVCSRMQQSIIRNSAMFGMDEGFDPQSQAGPNNNTVDPNCPQDNPYPALNSKMRRMEETTVPYCNCRKPRPSAKDRDTMSCLQCNKWLTHKQKKKYFGHAYTPHAEDLEDLKKNK